MVHAIQSTRLSGGREDNDNNLEKLELSPLSACEFEYSVSIQTLHGKRSLCGLSETFFLSLQDEGGFPVEYSRWSQLYLIHAAGVEGPIIRPTLCWGFSKEDRLRLSCLGA